MCVCVFVVWCDGMFFRVLFIENEPQTPSHLLSFSSSRMQYPAQVRERVKLLETLVGLGEQGDLAPG